MIHNYFDKAAKAIKELEHIEFPPDIFREPSFIHVLRKRRPQSVFMGWLFAAVPIEKDHQILFRVCLELPTEDTKRDRGLGHYYVTTGDGKINTEVKESDWIKLLRVTVEKGWEPVYDL